MLGELALEPSRFRRLQAGGREFTLDLRENAKDCEDHVHEITLLAHIDEDSKIPQPSLRLEWLKYLPYACREGEVIAIGKDNCLRQD